MEQNNSIKTAWMKFAVLVFFFIVIVTALFSGHPGARNGISPFYFLDTVVFDTVTYQEVGNLLFIGFLSGAVGGMLGMGGGVLKIVNLHYLLGFDIYFARIVSLLSYFVISLAAFSRYKKYNLIIWDIAKILIPSSILGVLIGVIIGNWINKEYLEIILGIYALFAGIVVLNQVLVKTSEKEIIGHPRSEINDTTVSGIGVGMGMLCSIIGISGGVLSTPLQNMLLKLPLKNSIANTIAAAVFSSFTASVILLFYGLKNLNFIFEDVLLVSICLIPGNIVGALFGSYLTKRLQINYVRVTFAIVAFVIGFKILTR